MVSIKSTIEKIGLYMFPRKGHKEPKFFLGNGVEIKTQNQAIYRQAMLHSSMGVRNENGNKRDNERLEFLGDSVLHTIITDLLYEKYPTHEEGFLSQVRGRIESREEFNRLAKILQLDKLLKVGKCQQPHSEDIYGNAFEALFGAMYLDKGYAACKEFYIKEVWLKYVKVERVQSQVLDHKSQLYQKAAKQHINVNFDSEELSKSPNPKFRATVLIEGKKTIAKGVGRTKKEAEQNAAKAAFCLLK